MTPKTKALLFNFLGFALLFVAFRFLIGFLFPLQNFVAAVIAAVLASVLAPKFGAVKTKEGQRLFMKWPFTKNGKAL
ncbi:hypothetical protein [Maribacter sp. 2307ULW6-5]|uniref:hypothetical protein n=1 Tax=Maribacter sp. 2307ULW6-5 TaxID=3386275 RepID=UPI0039BC9AA7